MKIRWNGGEVTRRTVGRYEWSRDTGYVQDVADPELAADLLTDPSGLFAADEGEDVDALFSTGETDVAGKSKRSKKGTVEDECEARPCDKSRAEEV